MTITLNSVDQLADVFAELGQEFDRVDYSPVLGEFADDLRDVHQNYFLGEFGPSGADWKPWRWRDPNAPNNHPTLNVTGRLRDSLVKDGGEHVEKIDPRGMDWGTSTPYAGQHNFGGVSTVPAGGLVGRFGGYLPPGKQIVLPQREHVGIDGEKVDQYTETLADAAVEAMRE